MLKIRMQRTGRTNAPSFRIVVTEHTTSPRSGNFVEKLGTYNPKTKALILNAERIKYWLSVGAQASGTVYNMFVSEKLIEGKKKNVLPQKSPIKKDSEQKTENSTQQAPLKEEVSAPELKDEVNVAVETVAPEAKSE